MTEVRTAVTNKFSSLDQGRIIYAAWSDVGGDDYRSYVDYFYNKFNEDNKFAEAVKSIVRGWVSKESRPFSESQINRLCHYVLEELPECLKQVPIKGLSCEAWTYPYSGELVDFIDDLQQGKIFPEVSTDIIKAQPKVFLEVR